MSVKIYSLSVHGLEAEIVEVESDTGGGELGSFSVVGLPDTAVSEARERVRLAIRNSGLEFPKLKVTVNLAPANVRKQGSAFDLPIALSILLTTGRLRQPEELSKSLFVGELALDGSLRPVNGALPMAIKAKKAGFKTLYLPKANAREAALVPDLEIYAIENLLTIINFWLGREEIDKEKYFLPDLVNCSSGAELADISGHEAAKRALEVAAAGGHNLLLSGPPGSGKTLLAKAIVSILPDLTLDEALEVTRIYSVSGLLPPGEALIKERPFRAPHHSASSAALIGGGTWPKPGEISLAHRGVLFIDELPEMPRVNLETLRQPLEDGVVTISRVAGNLKFPAKFILVAAMNPCPCGFAGDPEKECQCSRQLAAAYTRKLSGPILDRFDLRLEVPRLEFSKLNQGGLEKSADVKIRVERARKIQAERFIGTGIFTNAEMSSAQARKYCTLGMEEQSFFEKAAVKLLLSPRAYFRVLKTSRTIADLAESRKIQLVHLAEALQYRQKDN